MPKFPVIALFVALQFATLTWGQDLAPSPMPRLVTAKTLADADRLRALERPGRVLFQDDFESAKSLDKYFEIRGAKNGRARWVDDKKLAHLGTGAIQFTAPKSEGRSSGAGASGWLGKEGHDVVYFRRYIRFAEGYDQGHLNHTGGGLAALAGEGKWDEMGRAGLKPGGKDRFTTGFEPWRDWGRYDSPGYLFVYAYWMDMKRDRDGNFWGNMLGPGQDRRLVPPRGKWVCLEHMMRANTPGEADGELAAWVDGKLYLHYQGIRWRSSASVRIKRFSLGIYIHRATQDNRVWYDDVVVSTGYVGPTRTPQKTR